MTENVVVLEKGLWTPDEMKIHKITGRKNIRIYPGDLKAIEENWKRILAKNKNAFPGPTIRLVGRHHLKEKMILEVIPSDYRESNVISWLGVAMVPVTTDGCIGLQGPVASISATIGRGIRAPGCTPVNTEVIEHVITEMEEEFGVNIARDDITIHGLVEVKPPVASLHHALVAKVRIHSNFKKLEQSWKTAKDKREGRLIPLKLDYKKKKMLFRKIGGRKAINSQSLVILEMIAKSEFSIYEKIWQEALKYQDFRDDKGHAAVTLRFAEKLLKTEEANPDIVIPAIILHDIGWSRLSKEERFLIFRRDKTEKQELEVRYKHQEEGCKIAKKILENLGYDNSLIEQIKEIISQHDTRRGTFSKEDSIVRDADKLWRFSETGFWADLRRMDISKKDLHDKLEKQIGQEGFFFTESAKKIAREELKRR